MNILGLQKLTLLDYPEHLAAILFLGSCNFRCPFCQNSSLVLEPETLPVISREDFLSFLKKRAGILDGIVVTGGEPTLHADLPDLLRDIHNAGYLVKLDTNGTNPAMLQSVIDDGLVDYVAMDIKAGRRNYRRVCGLEKLHILNSDLRQVPGEPDTLMKKVENSIQILKNSSLPYEFRTTVVRGLHTTADFEDIASWLSPLSDQAHYYLQSFRDCPEVLQSDHSFSEFSAAEMQEFLQIVQKKIPQASLRG